MRSTFLREAFQPLIEGTGIAEFQKLVCIEGVVPAVGRTETSGFDASPVKGLPLFYSIAVILQTTNCVVKSPRTP